MTPLARSSGGRGQPHGERRALTERLAMSSRPRWRLTMCLTIARPSPVPPNSRERRGIDPVEALGQPRQVLARDALALVGDGQPHLAGGLRPLPNSAASPSLRRARPAVFDRVVEQVLEDLRQFVALALHLGQLRPAAPGRCGCRARRRAVRGRAPLPSTSGGSATPPVGAMCSFSSMRDSDSRSSTSRVMRPACSCMMPRNARAPRRRRAPARAASR